jgi:predicted dehydrogenase
VRGKGKLVVQPEQSLKVIKILEAIAKSAASGQEVKL